MVKPFLVEKSQLITATTTSQEVALSSSPHIMIITTGTPVVLVAFGSKGVVATANSVPCVSNRPMVFTKPANAEFIALLASSATSTVSIVEGRNGL